MNAGASADPQRRVLLVRFGSMGDIVHALPAAAALRAAHPDWRIDWLVETRWRELLENNGCLDQVIALDTLGLRKNFWSADSWRTLHAAPRRLEEAQYDFALDLQGALKSALACRFSGARKIIGFEPPWLREPAAGVFYTQRVTSNAQHMVEANLDLAAALGAAADVAEFPLPAGDASKLPPELAAGGYAVMNPGAGWRSKCWPAASFAAVSDALAAEQAMRTALNCGPGERGLCEQVQAACRAARPVIFSGDVPALIALLRPARLMLGPDTGPLHLAAALGVPTVGLYGPTDPARNGPYGRCARALRAAGAETSHQHDAEPDGAMQRIPPVTVLRTIHELLARQPR